MIDYRIVQGQGYSKKIGSLVSMMDYSRAVLLDDIKNLSQEDLDFLPEGLGNTIGALLMHIASIEFVHQLITFENRDINENERLKWGTALELGEKAMLEIKGKSLVFYLNELNHVREKTLTLLKSQKDNWLLHERKWDNGISYNHYWMWYHVMEDEINHRGQIRIIKRLLNKN
ncbi:DinB family protein [Peribacillus alkalitolerans]|uniref:DinB family protein n=1 Tax=Peribacillus alkalitolerans TaxID=1550385 RepID=UPI0013D64E0C|nr:DinB family protein [Peribacillus alkalitolerans]